MVSFIESSHELMSLNKKTCLLFNQLQNDISSTFVPFLQEEEKKAKDEKEVLAEKKKEKPKDPKYFLGQIYEEEYRRIEGKKWELFKSLNFICTNPLEVYGENRPRLVRIKYELAKDKAKSQGEKLSYNLFRKETYELQNVDFQQPEERSPKEKEKLCGIRSYLIADNIKDFFVEYVTDKPPKEKEKTTAFAREEEEPQVRNFEWNIKIIQKIFPPKKEEKLQEEKKEEEIKYVVPRYLEIVITFWDERLQNQHSFGTLIPIWSHPTQEPKKDKKAPGKTPASIPGVLPSPPAPPPPVPPVTPIGGGI